MPQHATTGPSISPDVKAETHHEPRVCPSWFPPLIFFCCSLLSAAASADVLEATLGQPLHEVSHSVAVQVEQGVVTYKVRRSFANEGTRHDEAYLRLGLPYGAAATGLRIRSGRRWFTGELMERERAATLYQKLTGIGPHTPRDPALLRWLWPSELALHLFPVPPGSTATVEYTLTVPTRYAQGRYLLAYPVPAAARNLCPAVLRVSPELPRALVKVDGKLVAGDQPLVLGAAHQAGWLAQQQLESNASHAVSELEVDWDRSITRAKVELDVRHSYRADLQLQLVTPQGSWHTLFDREGGGENHLRSSFQVELPRPQQARGTWRLVVSDHAIRDVGSLERWSLTLTPAPGAGNAQPVSWSSMDTPLFIPDAPQEDGADHATIEIAPPPIRTLTARLGRQSSDCDCRKKLGWVLMVGCLSRRVTHMSTGRRGPFQPARPCGHVDNSPPVAGT